MRIGLEALTSLHRRLWKPRPPPPSCAAMTGEVMGDVTGDVIGDVISEANALTVRRALLSAPGGAPPPSPCAQIWFRFRQNFRTEGEHPGRTGNRG